MTDWLARRERCEWRRQGFRRCRNPATAHFVRLSHTSEHAPFGEEAFVCALHLMGDGKEGRRDWGWFRLEATSE